MCIGSEPERQKAKRKYEAFPGIKETNKSQLQFCQTQNSRNYQEMLTLSHFRKTISKQFSLFFISFLFLTLFLSLFIYFLCLTHTQLQRQRKREFSAPFLLIISSEVTSERARERQNRRNKKYNTRRTSIKQNSYPNMSSLCCRTM